MNMVIRKYAARVGVVALCSAVLCSVPMMAQGGGGGGQGGGGGRGGGRMTPEARVAAIDKAVTLTDDQKTKITALLTADQQKMTDIRTAANGDMQVMMTKMTAFRTDENNQIKAMLTDDQKPKFDAYLAAQPQFGGGRPGGGAPGGAPPAAPPQ